MHDRFARMNPNPPPNHLIRPDWLKGMLKSGWEADKMQLWGTRPDEDDEEIQEVISRVKQAMEAEGEGVPVHKNRPCMDVIWERQAREAEEAVVDAAVNVEDGQADDEDDDMEPIRSLPNTRNKPKATKIVSK